MAKHLRSVIVTAMSVLLAGVALALDGPGVALAAMVIILMAGFGTLSGKRARSALPGRPKAWADWVGRTEWYWIAPLIAVAAAALYFAVQLGDELDESIAGTAALGAVAGVALVKVLDQLASESDWIDERTESLAKTAFKAAYEHQFDTNQPAGPLPHWRADDPQQESDEYFAVHFDDRYGGWGDTGRAKRAEALAHFIDNHQGISWV